MSACRRIVAVTVVPFIVLLHSVQLFSSADDLPSKSGSVSGVLRVVQEDDFVRGHSRVIHILEEKASGKKHRLRLDGEPDPKLRSGAIVVAHGQWQNDEFVVDPVAGGIEIVQEAKAAAAPAKDRKAVVLVVDFRDSSVTCTDSQVADLMFTGTRSVDGLYQETSSGEVSFPADTDGDGQPDVFRVSINSNASGNCSAFSWASSADSAASGAGVNLSLYQHKIYVLPGDTSCGWAGMADVGCSSGCRVWNTYCHFEDVYAHELGHNLGLGHASTDQNDDGVMDCEYCDLSDFMGLAGVGWRQLNGPHKEMMGWLPSNQSLVLNGEGDLTYTLSPLAENPAVAPHPQMLKVQKPGTSQYYHVTYRGRTGYDQPIPSTYADKTNIHLYPGGTGTRYVAAVADGQTFYGAGDVAITQLSHDAASATVRLSLGCSATAPTTTAAPTTRRGLAGEEVTYNVTVVNNDSVSCGTSTFDVTAGVPPGWTGSVADPVLVLAPGEQATTTLYVSSSVDATENPYPVEVQMTDPATPAHDATGAATYEVLDTVCDGPDGDQDGVTDDCDTCPSLYNPAQSDQDGDHEGDACDMDDGMIYLLFSDPSYVEWQAEWGFDSWDCYEGDLQVLRDTGVYTQSPGSNPIAGQDCGLTDPWAADFDPPPPGMTAFFLVVGRSSGASSGLGQDGQGTERPAVDSCP